MIDVNGRACLSGNVGQIADFARFNGLRVIKLRSKRRGLEDVRLSAARKVNLIGARPAQQNAKDL